MAAVHGNALLTQAGQNLPAILAAQRKALETMDAGERRVMFREGTKDLCTSIITAAVEVDTSDPQTLKEFHVFPKLPAELRLKIWRHAIDAPRIIELRKVQAWVDCFSHISTPLLFRVNRESNEETIRAYAEYHSTTSERLADHDFKTQWVRFDRDIIHIKPLAASPLINLTSLSHLFTRPGLIGSLIRQWPRHTAITTRFGSDKWLNRPARFNKITNLAISRDLLNHLPDDYEPFIRHFFPNLLTLIVLVDDDIDIDTEWKIWDLQYKRYEDLIPQHLGPPLIPQHLGPPLNNSRIPRLELAMKTTGPFKEVKLNIDYRMEIEFEMRKRFTKEEHDYNWYTAPRDYNWYTAPRIRVLGASIPEGVVVGKCGRLPDELSVELPEEKKYGGDPFDPYLSDFE